MSKISKRQLDAIFMAVARNTQGVQLPWPDPDYGVPTINLYPDGEKKGKRETRFRFVFQWFGAPDASSPGASNSFSEKTLVRENGAVILLTFAQVGEMLVRAGLGFGKVSITLHELTEYGRGFDLVKRVQAVQRFNDGVAIYSERIAEIDDYIALVGALSKAGQRAAIRRANIVQIQATQLDLDFAVNYV